MKLSRLLLALAVVGCLVGVAYVGQAPEPAGAHMAAAAQKFLDSLQPDQKAACTFAFDDKERTNWAFVPLEKDKQPTRKGLRLEKMTDEQKAAALDLLRAGTSPSGYTKATTIMSLENILKELEAGKGPVRNPGWYFFTVFGTPSKMGKWGWRVEGHHLSLNFTLDGGKLVSATPAFFGANPATVMDGPRKGLQTLPEAEGLARELFLALDQDQRAAALQRDQFKEPLAQKAAPVVGEPKGVPGAKMNEKQRGLLERLIEAYTKRMPPDIGEAEWKEAQDAGLDKVYFAWTGGSEPGEPHTYRVQGPTFLIEFLNVQKDSGGNPANHIHSCWRSTHGDFGIGSE
jgi:hypothetical protein